MTPSVALFSLCCATAFAPAFAAAAAATAGRQSDIDAWNEPSGVPEKVLTGGGLVATGPDTLYILCGRGGEAPAPTPFYEFTISTGRWRPRSGLPVRSGAGAAMAFMPGSNHVYVVQGLAGPGATTEFYRYSIADVPGEQADAWTRMPPLPLAPDIGMALAATAAKVYAFGGGKGFWEFTPGADWTSKAGMPSTLNATLGAALVYPGGGNYLYAIPGSGNSGAFCRYAIAGIGPEPGNTWTRLADLPATVDAGSALCSVGGPGGSIYCNPGGAGGFFRFDIDPSIFGGGSWTALSGCPGPMNPLSSWAGGGGAGGAGLAYPGTGDTIVALRGGNTADVWRYSISRDEFSDLAKVPELVADGAAMTGVGDGDHLYLLPGNQSRNFYRYSTKSNAWTALASTPEAVQWHSSLAYDGGDSIYAMRGWTFRDLWRYSIYGDNPEGQGRDTWVAFTGAGALPEPFGGGGRLVYGGSGYLYCMVGKNTPEAFGGPYRRFYRYSIADGTWEPRQDIPLDIQVGSDLVAPGGDLLYALEGGKGGFRAYSKLNDSWSSPPDPADLPDFPGSGASMCYRHSDDRIYAMSGLRGSNAGTLFWAFTLPDAARTAGAWTQVASLPGTAYQGACLSSPGGGRDFLVATPGNRNRTLWYYGLPNVAPILDEASLRQFKLDGSTPITSGDYTLEPGFVVSATITIDLNGDGVALEAEASGSSFAEGHIVLGSFTQPGSTLSIAFPDLPRNVDYRWRLRAADSRGKRSGWIYFGGGSGERDVRVRTSTAPVGTGARQAMESDGREIAEGLSFFSDAGVVFQASFIDIDGDPVRFDVELQPIGSPFTGIPTASTEPMAGGSGTASVTLSCSEGGNRWRYRFRDDLEPSTAWVDFGSDLVGPDFVILTYGSVNSVNGCLAGPASRPAAGTGLPVLASILAALIRLSRSRLRN